MPGNRCILQLRGLRPFYSPKYDLRNHPNYKHTAEADKRNYFDAARLVNRRMKPRPDDMYTHYDVTVSQADDDDILNYDDLDDPDEYA